MTRVTIYVVPSGDAYDKNMYGSALSTATDLYVNKVNDEFTIVFDLKLFRTFVPRKVIHQIKTIMINNMPDERDFEFKVDLIGTMSEEDKPLFAEFNNVIGREFEKCSPVVESGYGKEPEVIMRALHSEGPINIENVEPDEEEDVDGWWNEFVKSDEDDVDNDEYDEYDPNNFFNDYAYAPKLKKPGKKTKYDQSVIWHKSKNIKRSINRHGVVISSKDNMRRDKKLIKSFLKDFIPGEAGWKKEFREELAKRWLSVYAISKKTLKDLEKGIRNKRTSARKSKTAKTMMNLTEKLFNEDTWNNPNK